ncbi:MAG: polymer-forming cytoskeletal protein [Candidatus Binatia bacterium]
MAIWHRRAGRLPAPPPPARRAEQAPPEFLAPPPPVRAMLDRESEVSGKLSFTGPTRIDGALRGEVRATGMLIIGETGYVDGVVRAVSLLLLGRVEGEVVGADRVEIGPTGVLSGRVETRALVVREGGTLQGECRVTAARATVHVLRPRELSPDQSAAAPTGAARPRGRDSP